MTSVIDDKIDDIKFEKIYVPNHESVIKITDKSSGLLAIVALHDLRLGMALGGTRIYPYKSFDDALFDVLRLAEGMTYKAAVSEVGFGGGKSVIIADPKAQKTQKLLLAFGRAIDKLNGKYICAEDMGCTTKDVMTIRHATKYVVGLPHKNSSGDPGIYTAHGVLRGIEASLLHLLGSPSIRGKKIVIQGLGNVGRNLLEFLFWQGADLVVSDIDQEAVDRACLKYNCKSIEPQLVYDEKCDVFCPCAMGGIINDKTIDRFDCKIIAGAANNQLFRKTHAEKLKEKNILYAPDFVINAGGLLNVSVELKEKGYCPLLARDLVDNIANNLRAIFEIAKRKNITTDEAAISLAQYKIENGIGKRIDELHFHHKPI
jgi:leucine dehydrogenase